MRKRLYRLQKQNYAFHINKFLRLPKQSILRERLLRFDEKSKTRNDGIIN